MESTLGSCPGFPPRHLHCPPWWRSFHFPSAHRRRHKRCTWTRKMRLPSYSQVRMWLLTHPGHSGPIAKVPRRLRLDRSVVRTPGRTQNRTWDQEITIFKKTISDSLSFLHLGHEVLLTWGPCWPRLPRIAGFWIVPNSSRPLDDANISNL